MGDEKIKYLEFLENAITRMASNSFLTKGWSITIATVVLGLAAKDTNPKFAVVAILPIVLFWSMDAYYLALERSFRDLYSTASQAVLANQAVTLSLVPTSPTTKTWLSLLFRPAVGWIHAPMLALVLATAAFGFSR